MGPPPARPYILNRVVLVIGLVAWNLALGLPFLGGIDVPWWLIAPAVLLGIRALFLIGTVAAFKVPFSALGPKPRTKLPRKPIDKSRLTGGRVGWANSSFVRWMVYKDGIGFKDFSFGKGFVSFNDIRITKKTLFGGLKVEHDSMEVRSPLQIPSRRLRKVVETSLEEWRSSANPTARNHRI